VFPRNGSCKVWLWVVVAVVSCLGVCVSVCWLCVVRRTSRWDCLLLPLGCRTDLRMMGQITLV
jgi:hypothetical protein